MRIYHSVTVQLTAVCMWVLMHAIPVHMQAQGDSASSTKIAAPAALSVQSPQSPQTPQAAERKWYDNISLRGYAQIRYNRLLETNPDLGCEQCDRSWGKNGGFSIRRARIILSSQISQRVYIYVQSDLASSASSDRLHFLQLRDAYVDVGFDADNEFRLRIGQSKVPFGFENLQSSQNRLPLDRSDSFNSALANERDLGAFFYWAPREVRERFSMLTKSTFKGSGDYGVVAIGAYNGQTSNAPELNDEAHLVARVSYPFVIGSQIVEIGVQGYTGQFVLTKANLSSGVKYASNLQYLDQRVAASLTIYPKPFGIQAEYNVGKGPEFNPVNDSIELRSLRGGYILVNYPFTVLQQTIIPFIRWHFYVGGKKTEKDARSYDVKELEVGAEWQPFNGFELTAMYTISSRRYVDFGLQSNDLSGRLLRIQSQFNF